MIWASLVWKAKDSPGAAILYLYCNTHYYSPTATFQKIVKTSLQKPMLLTDYAVGNFRTEGSPKLVGVRYNAYLGIRVDAVAA